jgi:hypothetical protein
MKTNRYWMAILAICLFLSTTTYAQIDVEGKVKNKSINRADDRTDQAIDKGLDAIEDGVKNLFKKNSKTTKPTKETDDRRKTCNLRNLFRC